MIQALFFELLSAEVKKGSPINPVPPKKEKQHDQRRQSGDPFYYQT